MDYYNKYLKYKTKYLNLKYNNHQYGGAGCEKLDKINSLPFKLTAVEIIFIFGDTTSKDFTGKISDIKRSSFYDRYTIMRNALVSDINANQSHLILGFLRNKMIASNTLLDFEQNLRNLLAQFIDKYIIVHFSTDACDTIAFNPDTSFKLQQKLQDLNIRPIFTKLFNDIQLMLLGLDSQYNIIDEYLLFHLLSTQFLNYTVEFINYHKDFNTIDYNDANVLGVLVNAHDHKLCLFTCDNSLICYNYTTLTYKWFDWKRILATDGSLYISADGELINKDSPLMYESSTTLSKVLYITIIQKVPTDRPIKPTKTGDVLSEEVLAKMASIVPTVITPNGNARYEYEIQNTHIMSYILYHIIQINLPTDPTAILLGDLSDGVAQSPFIPARYMMLVKYILQQGSLHYSKFLQVLADDEYPPAIADLNELTKVGKLLGITPGKYLESRIADKNKAKKIKSDEELKAVEEAKAAEETKKQQQQLIEKDEAEKKRCAKEDALKKAQEAEELKNIQQQQMEEQIQREHRAAEAAKAEAAKALEQQTHDALEQERKKQSTNNICIPNPAGEYFSLSKCNKKK